MTKGERILWQSLRKKQLGFRVRRQYAVGPYVLDFYVHAARLAIEIDGPDHDIHHDRERDDFLGEMGIRTLRLSWQDLPNRLNYWLEEIRTMCQIRAALQPKRTKDSLRSD